MFSGLGMTGLAFFSNCEALAPSPVALHQN
jgi:hypothetical protein